jgi:hypothetical protein
MEKSKKGKGGALFEVVADFKGLEKEKGEVNAAAYVYDRAGYLLGKQPLTFDKGTLGKATFDLETAGEKLVVKIGPDVENHRILDKYQPAVETLVAKPDTTERAVIDLPEKFWICWLKVPYVVTGDVKKKEDDGYSAVCWGEVDIYDVDIYYCIIKLPELVLERIRESIIDIIVDPPRLFERFEKIPERIYEIGDDDYDWCGTPSGPIPIPPRPLSIEKKFAQLPAELQFINQRYKSLSTAKARMDASIQKMSLMERSAWLNTEPLEGITVSQIINTNTLQFRNLLIDKFQSFRFYLCWYPWIYWLWWPYCRFYTFEKLGTAQLKAGGTFTKTIKLSICRQDVPDLWFVVRQKIDGVEKTIYKRYPVHCNTYWNHPSGKPVHLVVTDPDAVVCNQPPVTDLPVDNLWVVPLAVGNYSLKRIYGTGAGTLPADNAKIGLYESISPYVGGSYETFTDGPFGGTLPLRFLFSRGLETAGVTHYRIKVRKNGVGDWLPLTAPVVRHYSHYDSVTESLTFLSYNIGPHTFGTEIGVYEICPRKTPLSAVEPDSDWYVTNAYVDIMDGYYNSSSITDGYVEFKLELFKKMSATTVQRVDPATFGGGIKIKIPSNIDIWNNVTTTDPALVNPALVVADPENPAFQTFILKLRINHEEVHGSIAEPKAMPSGNTANSCGVLRYNATDTYLEMKYSAWHPKGFAYYHYNICRSTSDSDVRYSTEGRVGTSSVTGEHTVPSPDNQITTLMGTCPMAAFSENMGIYHMAFSGWSRVGGMDKSFDRPFVLAPTV